MFPHYHEHTQTHTHIVVYFESFTNSVDEINAAVQAVFFKLTYYKNKS